MIRSPALRVSLVLSVAFAGCAYYNGLFNANRLAGDAERAERQGRSGEARSLWAQAAVKAESVATRYPSSRHRDDALLLWGRALYETQNCRRAVTPLALAVDSSPDERVQTEARLYLGQCQVELRSPDSAIAVLAPLLADSASPLAAEALLWTGRAEMARGRQAAAVSVLERVPNELAAFDLATAMASLGLVDDACRVLDLRVAGSYEETEWLAVLDSVGALDQEAASGLVERLVELRGLTPGQRARLLLADGRRWSGQRHPDRAAERFSAAADIAPDSVEAGAAAAYLAIAELRRTDDLERLPQIQASLDAAVRRGGASVPLAGQAAALVGRTVSALNEPATRRADLRLFVLAEDLRDSVAANSPAAALFLRLERDYPQSVVAPKALLAAAALEPARGDSIWERLLSRYPDSPYTLVLAGTGGDRFTALEDSLAGLLAQERSRLMQGRSGDEDVEREPR